MTTRAAIELRYRRPRMLLAFGAGVVMTLAGGAGCVASVVVFRPMALPLLFALAAAGVSMVRRYRSAWRVGGRAWRIDAHGLTQAGAAAEACWTIPWQDWIGSAFVPATGVPRRLLVYARKSPAAFGQPDVIVLPLADFDPAPLVDLAARLAAVTPKGHGFGPEANIVRGQWKTELGVVLGAVVALMVALPCYFFPDQPWWPGVVAPVLTYVTFIVRRHRVLTDPARAYPLMFWTDDRFYAPGHPLGAIGFEDIANGYRRFILTYIVFRSAQPQVAAATPGTKGLFTWMNFIATDGGRARLIAELTRRGLWNNGQRAGRPKR
jgi:hypothetical protein